MEAYDIIEVLNSYIAQIYPDNDGHFILHKQVLPVPAINAYKEIRYTLYYIHKSHKITVITTACKTRYVTDVEKEVVKRDTSMQFLRQLFDFIISGDMEKLIKEGYGTKQIPDIS